MPRGVPGPGHVKGSGEALYVRLEPDNEENFAKYIEQLEKEIGDNPFADISKNKIVNLAMEEFFEKELKKANKK